MDDDFNANDRLYFSRTREEPISHDAIATTYKIVSSVKQIFWKH